MAPPTRSDWKHMEAIGSLRESRRHGMTVRVDQTLSWGWPLEAQTFGGAPTRSLCTTAADMEDTQVRRVARILVLLTSMAQE